jgi:hypothetical protein
MPGVMVGGVKLEIDAAKMRDIADRLSKCRMTDPEEAPSAVIAADFNKLMQDAEGELRRLADGFDELARTEESMRSLGAFLAQALGPDECDCANCRARRAAERAAEAQQKRGLN